MINHRAIWLRSIVGGVLPGAVVGGLMMSAAWQHNPQGAIHDGAAVHWLYWLGIGLSWLLPVALVSGLITGVAWTVAQWLHPRSRNRANSGVAADTARVPRG